MGVERGGVPAAGDGSDQRAARGHLPEISEIFYRGVPRHCDDPAAVSLFGMEEQLENAFRFYRFSGEQEELREEMAGMGEIGRRAVLDQYETMLKAQLLDLAAQEEVVLTDIELLLETDEKSGSYGSVLYVSARVSEGEEGQTTALIRRLAVQWNMPEENINLHSGQGGGNYGY